MKKIWSYSRSHFFIRLSLILLMSSFFSCSPDEELQDTSTNSSTQGNQSYSLIGRWMSSYSTGVRYKTFYTNGSMTQETIDENNGTSSITVQYTYDETSQIVFLIGIGRPITWHSSTSFSLGSPLTTEDELHTKVN